MADSTQSSIEIAAPAEQVMAVIADLESYPDWIDALSEVEVLSRADDRPDTVRMVLAHRMISDDYTVAYTWLPERVSWRLLQGRNLTAMDGSYAVETVGQGCRVTYQLTVALKVPLLGPVRRAAEKAIIDAALKGLRQRVTQPAGQRSRRSR